MAHPSILWTFAVTNPSRRNHCHGEPADASPSGRVRAACGARDCRVRRDSRGSLRRGLCGTAPCCHLAAPGPAGVLASPGGLRRRRRWCPRRARGAYGAAAPDAAKQPGE